MLTSIPPRLDVGATGTGLQPYDTAGQEARSLFPQPAVKIDLSTMLRADGLTVAGGDNARPRPLIVGLISGFAEARRAGEAVRAMFSAMKSEVQSLALKLVEQRAEGNRQGAAMLSLLGDIPEAVREQAESLAKQAKTKVEGMQKSLMREARLDPLKGSLASLQSRLSRLAEFDHLVDTISRNLKFTAFMVHADADSGEEEDEARETEKRVTRSVSDIQDLKSSLNTLPSASKVDITL